MRCMRLRLSCMSCSQFLSLSMMVGLIRITSSLLMVSVEELRNAPPISGASARPGIPLRPLFNSTFIKPPSTTMLPSWVRTIVSDSLTLIAATSTLCAPTPVKLNPTDLELTLVTNGWICSAIFPLSSIWGVTSSEMPEKILLMFGATVVGTISPAVFDPGIVVILVTKGWSVPTLSTAFWLLSVATLGLDRTCTDPCDSRNCSNAAKFCVCSARPNTPPATFVAPATTPPSVPPTVEEVSPLTVKLLLTPALLPAVLPLKLPVGPKLLDTPPTTPLEKPPAMPCLKLNPAQLIPD